MLESSVTCNFLTWNQLASSTSYDHHILLLSSTQLVYSVIVEIMVTIGLWPSNIQRSSTSFDKLYIYQSFMIIKLNDTNQPIEKGKSITHLFLRGYK